jgi:hypothetical protein
MAHPVIGAGVGGMFGAVAGLVVAAGLSFHPGDSRDSVGRAIAAWKAKYPGFKTASDEEILEAMGAQSAYIAGWAASLGTFAGSLIGAAIGARGCAPSTGTGTGALPSRTIPRAGNQGAAVQRAVTWQPHGQFTPGQTLPGPVYVQRGQPCPSGYVTGPGPTQAGSVQCIPTTPPWWQRPRFRTF